MQVDPQLLDKCRKNDRKAHNELYHKCYGLMMAICLRYSNNREAAKASLNMAFLKIVTNLDKFREEVPFGSWVSRITVNSIIDEFRRDKRRRENMSSVDIEEVRSTKYVDYNEASENLDAEELEKLIQQVPEMSRKVFNLYAIDGYTHKEIGEMLGISDGTSKWHVSHARKILQDMLKQKMKKWKNVNY